MKKIVLFTMLTLGIALNAQTKDAGAVKLLNDVSSSYNKPTYIDFDFTLKNTKANVNQSEKGNVYISGDKYNLKLMNMSQIYDGKKVYNISSDDKEVTITSNPAKEDLMTPTRVLNSYKTGYTVKMNGSKTVNGKKASIIDLIPTDASSPTSKVEIAIDGANKDLLRVTEYTKEGSVTTININKVSKNAIIPKSMFLFKPSFYKGKGYYITEL